MSEPQPIRFSVPQAGFDLTLLPEAGRQRGSQAFQEALTAYYKDAYREAGGRVDVGFSEGQIEVYWEPQSGQLPASASIAAHLEAGRYDEAIPLLRTRLQLEPDHVESLYNLGMVYSDRMQLTEPGNCWAGRFSWIPVTPTPRWPWGLRPCGITIPMSPRALWRRRWCSSPATRLHCAPSASCI